MNFKLVLNNSTLVQIIIPTELIGSLPRTTELLEAQQAYKAGHISTIPFERVQDKAVRQTLFELEKTGQGQLTDGEQAKPSFLVYPYVIPLLDLETF